ncbi:hypothetical protein [Streptomyces sp.]|uniref:hypothetical protein n=1 Tax=Streptomyces sp. TaxID=1931 RepID=UPI002D7A282E|nr:hypothetical protein [Streptomyces sp.]HET6354847.1 hypothetical protein [Streptomyces sp.]
MDVDDLVQILAVDPLQLDPAPPWSPRMRGAIERLGATPKPCVACGAPARATRVVAIPGYGRRWIDRCRDHLIATTQRHGPPVAVGELLAVLEDAAHEARGELTIITDPLAVTARPQTGGNTRACWLQR